VIVDLTRPPIHGRPECEIRTLGDLLYANKTIRRVSEQEWVGLVRAIAAGDEQALHALYEQTHRIVFTLTMRITGNRETAEELTLDVFHDVWRRASAYDPASGSVIGWMMNQARSRAIDRLRFEQRKKRVPDHADRLSEHGGALRRHLLQTGMIDRVAEAGRYLRVRRVVGGGVRLLSDRHLVDPVRGAGRHDRQQLDEAGADARPEHRRSPAFAGADDSVAVATE